MPEIIHWKCDFPNCGAISPLHKGMPLGWVKVTAQVPFLDPLTVYFCPKHEDQFQIMRDIAVRAS